MEFRISHDVFLRGIQVVQNVAQPSISTPILENMLLKAEGDNKITFRTSNLTLSVSCIGEGIIVQPGEIAIPMKEVGQIAKELPEAELEIGCNGSVVNMKCGPASLRLRGIDAGEFPPFALLEDGIEIELSSAVLASMADKTVFATSAEKARYVLEGVKVDIEGSRLKFVATDGKRLSLVEKGVEKETETSISALVPGRAMSEVRRILKPEENVKVKIGEKKIEFSGKDFVISSNLLVDNFPPYRQLIPSELTIEMNLPTGAFLQAVRRAAVLVDDRTRMVILDVSEEGVLVSGVSQAHGEAETLLETEYKGETFKTAFRADYLVDVIRVLEGDTFTMSLKSPSSPAVIKDSADEGFLHVLMPMRIEEIEEEIPEEA